jgi:hypothetical protein
MIFKKEAVQKGWLLFFKIPDTLHGCVLTAIDVNLFEHLCKLTPKLSFILQQQS